MRFFMSLVASLCAVGSARAATGMIEIEEPALPDSLEIQTVTQTVEASPAALAVRPWMLNTPAGPTAFVLDSRRFEVSLESTPSSRILVASGLLLNAKVGLTDSITLGAGMATLGYQRGFVANPKWNFLNSGSDSFAVSPWIAYLPPDTQWGASVQGSVPVGLEISFSRVLEEGRILHLSAVAGMKSHKDTYSYQSSNSTSSSYSYHYSSESKMARLTLSVERRVSERNGFTFSLSPEASSDSNSYSGLSSTSSLNWTERVDIGVNLGLGYHFMGEKFGASIGLEGGPYYSIYKNEWRADSHLYPFAIRSGSIAMNYRF